LRYTVKCGRSLADGSSPTSSLTSKIKYVGDNSPFERENCVFGIDLAVSIMDGPDLSARRRKELALARLMAVAIGVILYTGESDSGIRLEAAKDMAREFRHVYPEIGEI
jgi:hypothetical protein